MPEKEALTVLPELRDEAKIDAVTVALLDAVKRKEVIFTGRLMLIAGEHNHNLSETVLEKICPIQFEPPAPPGDLQPTPSPPPAGQALLPTSFEKRNMGPTLEVQDVSISNDGQSICLDVTTQRVGLKTFDSYEIRHYRDGMIDSVSQPLFFNHRNVSNLTLKNGQRLLIGIHKQVEPEGQIEFFILQATVLPKH